MQPEAAKEARQPPLAEEPSHGLTHRHLDGELLNELLRSTEVFRWTLFSGLVDDKAVLAHGHGAPASAPLASMAHLVSMYN